MYLLYDQASSHKPACQNLHLQSPMVQVCEFDQQFLFKVYLVRGGRLGIPNELCIKGKTKKKTSRIFLVGVRHGQDK